jgi:DMSO/TMAO reductase YedYZ heme-binding membrane subunit
MHRRLSMIAAVFVALHVVTSVLDTYVDIGWAAVVVPFTSRYDSFWVGVGAVSLDLMAAVLVTSLLRSRLRPDTWRALHWLAYLCWPVALAHTFGMGTDSGERWVIALGVVCVATVLASLVWRMVVVSRQRAARTAHSAAGGVPPKHLTLGGSSGPGARRG